MGAKKNETAFLSGVSFDIHPAQVYNIGIPVWGFPV
jgi:hypothetical protein